MRKEGYSVSGETQASSLLFNADGAFSRKYCVVHEPFSFHLMLRSMLTWSYICSRPLSRRRYVKDC